MQAYVLRRHGPPRVLKRTQVPDPAGEVRVRILAYGVLASHVGYLLPQRERLHAVWRDLTDFVGRHGIRPVIGATFGFDQLAEAHALPESRASTGKIVVELA